jgi:hypothetical protein
MRGIDPRAPARTAWIWGGVVALGASIAGTACGGMTFIVQEYEGVPRPIEGIAIIRVEAGNGPEVVAVDDQPLRVALEKPNRIHVEVLPGPHEVDIEVVEPAIGLRHTIPVRFLASAGKVYRVEVLAVAASAGSSESHWDARAYEVDRDTDAHVGIAAPVAPLPPPPPPPSPPVPVVPLAPPAAPPAAASPGLDAGSDA